MPLTRAWCLLLVLAFSLTYERKKAMKQVRSAAHEGDPGEASRLRRTFRAKGFHRVPLGEGLWLCTSTGVLHEGKAGVDVALHLAKRLSALRLEDATASVQKDKDMTLDSPSRAPETGPRIDSLVSQMPGGFDAMNKFVKSNIAEAAVSEKNCFKSMNHPVISNYLIHIAVIYASSTIYLSGINRCLARLMSVAGCCLGPKSPFEGATPHECGIQEGVQSDHELVGGRHWKPPVRKLPRPLS